MSKLPTVTGLEVIRTLESFGFHVARVKGSHHILKKAEHPHAIAVPVHGRKELKRGTLTTIIRNAGLTVEEFTNAIDAG